MIRVTLPAPPSTYMDDVRIPGDAFLSSNPTPTKKDWTGHDYWRRIHPYLHNSMNGVCSYCASWTPLPAAGSSTNWTSVDHFIPKSVDPKGAYEWSNFRLCRARLNHRKSNHLDVIDPCEIGDDWFTLEFTTFLLKPAPHLPRLTAHYVSLTITRLELNSDPDYVSERISVILGYATGQVTFDFVQRRFPFIALQIQVQDFDTKFKPGLLSALEKVP